MMKFVLSYAMNLNTLVSRWIICIGLQFYSYLSVEHSTACHRERRRGDVGVLGTLTAHDMSWLRLQRDVSSPQTNREVSYTFGEDSFIRRFFSKCKEGGVSAWRILTGYRHCSIQNRIVYSVHQCHDADGPMLAPDFILGDDKRTVPLDYCAAAYQELLLSSNSAKKDGRHYVDGCWYYELPES